MIDQFSKPFRRLAPSIEIAPTPTDAADTFRFVFSNEKVGRDGFVVLNSAIEHENFDRNPVVLFAHDDKQPPIGSGSGISTSGENCTIDITFVPREILPFAGTIRDLVAGKWLRAVSLSWQPIEAKRSKDPDVLAIFTRIDMLETSVVPLPALPDALLAARSRGVDVRPLAQWAEKLLAEPDEDLDRIYVDTGSTGPRPQLEAIHRAASGSRFLSGASSRAARVARAQELMDAQRRRDRALELRVRIALDDAGLSYLNRKEGGDMKNLREARGHLARALKHHRELTGHHDDVAAECAKLREVHRGLTSTLAELGYGDNEEVARALADFNRCIRSIRKAHDNAEDTADSAAECCDRAEECLASAAAVSH